MKDLLITQQKIYISIKFKTELDSKVELGYCPEILTPETMKLLESTQNNITEDKTGKNVEITEVILVHYNIVNNDYQQDSRVLSTFVSNKSFG